MEEEWLKWGAGFNSKVEDGIWRGKIIVKIFKKDIQKSIDNMAKYIANSFLKINILTGFHFDMETTFY